MQPKVIQTSNKKLKKENQNDNSRQSKPTSSKIITSTELSKHKSYEIYSQYSPVNSINAHINSKKSKHYQQNSKNQTKQNINFTNSKPKVESDKKLKTTNIHNVNECFHFNDTSKNISHKSNNKQKNFKNSLKIKKNSKNIKQNENIQKGLGNILSESDSFQEIDSMEEDTNSKNNNNINININIDKEKNEYKRHLTSGYQNKQHHQYYNSKEINNNIQNNNNIESDDDIIVNDNEFENSRCIQSDKLQETKFPKLALNPFTKGKPEIILPERIDNINNSANITLKKNEKNEIMLNFNKKKYSKELNNHHIKTSTLGTYNKSSTNPNSSISNSNIEVLNNINNSLIKKDNQNSNYENLYNELLATGKTGNREKFLEILEKIFALPKELININYQDEHGNSALHYACDEGNLKIVEILIKANCDINLRNLKRKTPLHFSSKRGYFDISKLLIENGALLNVFDSEKNSPLHYVCMGNCVELLKYFLTKLPLADAKNLAGKMPIDLTNNKEIKLILENYLKTNENLYHKINIYSTSDSKMKDMLENSKLINNVGNKRTISSKDKIRSPKNNTKKNKQENKNCNSINITINNISNNKDEYDNSFKKNSNVTVCKPKSNNSYFNTDNNNKKNELKNSLRIKEVINNNKKQKNKKVLIQDNSNIINNTIALNNISTNVFKKTKTLDQFTPAINSYNFQNNNYINNSSLGNNNSNTLSNSRKKACINSSLTNKSFNNKIIKNTNISKYSIDKKGQLSGKNIHHLNDNKSKILRNNLKNINYLTESIDFPEKNLNNTEENISKISKNSKNIREKGASTSRKKESKKSKKSEKSESNLSKLSYECANNTTYNNNANLLDSINRSNIIDKTIAENLHCQLTLNSIEEERITPSSFVCLAMLGKGSFGEVYLVQKINTQEKFAMKVLRKERIMSQNLLKYAMAERNVLSLSNHPFIVKLNYAFQTSSKLFLILDYCSGGDLGKHLFFEKRFEENRAKFYICEVLLALENLHKRDIIFRDLKPDNVVLDEEGHCKLTDFGLSKEGVFDSTGAKSFCGSIAYLAPEMLKKQGHGKAVDWYLLGVLFYEMLVGITPFFTGRKEDIFYNIEYGELKIPNFISEKGSDLLTKLLERDPNKRLGGGLKDAQEIKEHPYFQDVDWDLIYNKKVKPPPANNYTNKMMHVYHRPRLFANDDYVNNSNDKDYQNILPGWSFINNEEI